MSNTFAEIIMKTSDFYYDLPQELIAQTPVEPRNSSRLMILHKDSGELEHRIFKDLPEYLRPGDCLILNDTRVIPARIYGVKEETYAVVEFLLLTQKKIMYGSVCASRASAPRWAPALTSARANSTAQSLRYKRTAIGWCNSTAGEYLCGAGPDWSNASAAVY